MQIITADSILKIKYKESTMAKRGNGEGSVYRRKSDGKWVGNVF